MMMIGDKKKVLAQILGADPRETKIDDSGAPDALETLAQELMDSVSSGDAKGAASALRACFAECGAAQDNGPTPTEG